MCESEVSGRLTDMVTDMMLRDRLMSHPVPQRAPLLNLQQLLYDYLFRSLPQQSHNHRQKGKSAFVCALFDGKY